jgi:hypothetical protein
MDTKPALLLLQKSRNRRKCLILLVRSVEIEPTWAQGPGDFESEKRRIRPPPQLAVLTEK